MKSNKPYEYYREIFLKHQYDEVDFTTLEWKQHQENVASFVKDFKSEVEFPYVNFCSSMLSGLNTSGCGSIQFGKKKLIFTGQNLSNGKYTFANENEMSFEEYKKVNPCIHFSNIGKIVTIDNLESDLFTDELLILIEKLIKKYNFVYVPDEYLQRPYDGDNPDWLGSDDDEYDECENWEFVFFESD